MTKPCKAVHFSWDKVAVGQESECWPWTGALNRWGYGACQMDGRQMNASRAAWFEREGALTDWQQVLHRCDNPACCNPKHLFIGTHLDNMRDRKAKGRYNTALRGEAHPRHNAKLTPELVLEARRLYAEGVSQSEIGRRWKLHSSVISRAVRGENWGHVS